MKLFFCSVNGAKFVEMEISELHRLFVESTGICTDTRNIINGSIFFSLKGNNFNGNKFAQNSIEQGAAFAVVDEVEFADHPNCILVSDVLETLQNLSSYHRCRLDIPLIAVTGSNGKTTTKELLNAVLSKRFNVAYTHGNLNNHIGVPLTLLSITDKHELALIEMGDNHPEEVAFLCNIAKPNYGFVTNVGKDHLEGFGSFEKNVLAKKEVFDYLLEFQGVAFVDHSDVLVRGMLDPRMAVVSFGKQGCYSYIDDLGAHPLVSYKSESGYEVTTRLFGGFNFNNVKLVYCIGKYFKVEEDQINEALQEFEPDNNRSQVLDSDKNTLIMDAYNANPSSVWEAVKSLSVMVTEKPKMVLLGDMFELGSFSELEHQEMLYKTAECGFDYAVFVGENYSKAQAPEGVSVFSKKEEAELFLKKIAPEGAIILLKGSRGMRMETFKDIL